MEKQNLMSSLRRLSSAELCKKLKTETLPERIEAIATVLRARGVETPTETTLKKITPLEKLNVLMDEVYEAENSALNTAIGEIFPSEELSTLKEPEIETLIKQINDLCKSFLKKKSKKEKVSDKKEGDTPPQSKKQLILDLIASGKTRKEISQMKVVSSAYLSKFYAGQ